MKKHSQSRKYLAITLLGVLAFSTLIYVWIFRNLPDPSSIASHFPTQSIRILDRQSRLLYEVLPTETGRHVRVDLQEIPLPLIQATLATEDVNFYHHPGVDAWGILRALWIDLNGGQVIAGGSTITQQLARNLLLEPAERNQRSIRRKLRESYLAWRLSRLYSKDEILSMYLNQTYYGGMAYGVEAAARTYFGKPVSELDLAQSALIAGLPQAPATYNPFTNPQQAKERQVVVLNLMLKTGFITSQALNLAENESLSYNEEPYPVLAPHFVMLVRNQIDDLISSNPELANAVSNEGITVYTTLNLDWQTLAEDAIHRQLDRLTDSPDGLGHNVNNAALVAIDPNNGEILALAGSAGYFDQERQGAINMAIAPRQPGSALKPLIYAAALDPAQPGPWTAATMILDVRTTFTTHDGKAYTPKNYDGLEHGPVLVRDALASSLNIPAVITLDHVGLERFASTLERFGVETLEAPQDLDLSLALGGGSVSLLELTRAYAVFANTGYRLDTFAIDRIENNQGKLIYTHTTTPKVRILDERLAWLMSDILSDKDARDIGFGKNTILQLDRPAAVKTGTTTNFHDNWTVGYTPELVVGVWVGNADNQPMRDVTGLTGAAPIWHQFMRGALTEVLPSTFTRPDGLIQLSICNLSGLIPSPSCPYQRQEWFIDGTQPTLVDTLFHKVTIDRSTGELAGSDTPSQNRQSTLALDLPLAAQEWVTQHGYVIWNNRDPTTSSEVSGASSQAAQVFITNPAQNALYRLSSKVPLASQAIQISASTTLPAKYVELWLDGNLLVRLETPPYQHWWSLQVGQHQLWVQVVQDNSSMIISPVISFEVEPANR